MSSASTWLPVAAVLGAAVLLIRETRDIIPSVLDPVAASGAAAGQSRPGQAVLDIMRRVNVAADQLGRVGTAVAIEQTREGASNFGTVGGSIGEFSGLWSQTPAQALAGRCQVLDANRFASNATRYFTGGYCRRAGEMGLI